MRLVFASSVLGSHRPGGGGPCRVIAPHSLLVHRFGDHAPIDVRLEVQKAISPPQAIRCALDYDVHPWRGAIIAAIGLIEGRVKIALERRSGFQMSAEMLRFQAVEGRPFQ